MLFTHFAQHLQKLESLPSRLAMTETLAELFKQLDKNEVKKACYLMQGTLVPAYESLEFQLSTKMVIRALAKFMPNSETSLFEESSIIVSEVEKLYKKNGDLGETTYVVLQNFRAASKLTVLEVYDELSELAFENGEGSQQRKLEKLQNILEKSDAVAAKYIVRIILGKLRLGFSTMTMIDALSWAVTGGKEHRKVLEDAYQKRADIGSLAEYYLQNITDDSLSQTSDKLEKEYTVVVGIPVVPALCQRLNTSVEIIEKMKKVYVEPKYDGLRVQIHVSKNKSVIKVFTRNLETVTEMFPEVKNLEKYINAHSVIFDGEAIGYNPKTGDLLPFQQTMNRKRKHDIETVAENIPLKFFIYDVLSIDGKELIQEPLSVRKKYLETVLEKNDIFVTAPYIITDNADEVREFHQEQLAAGLEGAVIKQVEAPYQSGRKGWSWVKIKEAEGSSGKLSDTVDAVIMGYYAGRGVRAQFGLGAILMGIYDSKQEMYVTVTKVGTGMSDQQLQDLKKLVQPLETNEMPKNFIVHKNLIPDTWVSPKIVLEIAADEITKSPTHSAGYALRFPRLIKIRDDKKAEDATTVEELGSINIA